MLPIKKLLCPTDFSEPSLAALDVACELARHFDAELRVLHVIPFTLPVSPDMAIMAAADLYPSDRELSDEALRQVKNFILHRVLPGTRADAVVKMGNAAHAIVSTADDEEVAMIVMGTHGASGWRHLAFGSVTEKVVRMAHRPVLTVHNGPPLCHAAKTEATYESAPAKASLST